MYLNGTGVDKDYKKATEWWHLSANQGNARAMFNIGATYANGLGVARDLVEAYAWMYLANGGASFDFSGEQVTVDYSPQVTQLEAALERGDKVFNMSGGNVKKRGNCNLRLFCCL